MENSLISVIVPVYKVEKYLDRCVESIVNQTYKNLEIILVDDGSPDNCPAMCDEWAKKDNRIKVIHKNNDGLANARNEGILIATGDYIMFVDSDDWIELDMIEYLFNLSDKYNADISRCGFYFNYEHKKLSVPFSDNKDIKLYNHIEQIKDLMIGNLISGVAWNKLYKIQIVKSHLYDKKDGSSEDIMHNYRIYRDGVKTVFCDEPKYHYFIRNGSITKSDFGDDAFSIIRAKRIIYENEKDHTEILSYLIRGYVQSLFIVLSGCISNNACMDRYDELRNTILSFKTEILKSNLYTKLDKIKTIILFLTPKLYNILIKMKG